MKNFHSSDIPGYTTPGKMYTSVIPAENLAYKRKLVSVRVRSKLECATMCVMNPACSAFSYSLTTEENNCVLWTWADPGDNNDAMITWDLFLNNLMYSD